MIRSIMLWVLLCVSLLWGQTGIIIDHHCTDPSKIPESWIIQAKNTLRIGYSHTSHGSQLVSGMEAIRGEIGSRYDYTQSSWGANSGVFLNDYWANEYAEDLGHNGDLGWRNATIIRLQSPSNDRNVVIWSWCGGVSDNDSAGIDIYLGAINQLETAYPGIRFVYMTGHLDGGGRDGNLHVMNERIRRYCIAHNKILFDFADIESYDPGGQVNFMELYATDGCEYDRDGDGNPWGDGNWAAEWLAAHPGSELAQLAAGCGDCAHSERLNCVLKGRAVWWMLARLAGWDGTTSTPVTESPHAMEMMADVLEQNFPNPFTSASLIGYRLAKPGPVDLSLFTILGTRIQTLVQGYQSAGIHRISLKGIELAPGIYVYRLRTGSGTLSRTMQVVR